MRYCVIAPAERDFFATVTAQKSNDQPGRVAARKCLILRIGAEEGLNPYALRR